MTRVLAFVMLLVLTTAPSFAQTGLERSETRLLGLPLYSFEGTHIGQVTAVVTYNGERRVIGDVSGFMALGTRRVLIPYEMLSAQEDRVVLSISTEEIADVLFPERDP